MEPVFPPPVLPKEKITKKQQAALEKEKKAAERPSNTQAISKWFKPVPREPVAAIAAMPAPELDDIPPEWDDIPPSVVRPF